MLNKTNSLIAVLIFYLLQSCSDLRKKKDKSEFLKSIGTYKNNLEDGYWRYYNKRDDLIEQGNYSNGLRIGKWIYSGENKDTIVWNKFMNSNSSISTNIPDFFINYDNYDTLIYFKIKDTSLFFNLVISNGKIEGVNNFIDYKSQLLTDLNKIDFRISDSSQQVLKTNSNSHYLYNRIGGVWQSRKKIEIFNFASLGNDGKMIEISLRCDAKFQKKGQLVFFSVIQNLFLNSKRFINMKDSIISIH